MTINNSPTGNLLFDILSYPFRMFVKWINEPLSDPFSGGRPINLASPGITEVKDGKPHPSDYTMGIDPHPVKENQDFLLRWLGKHHLLTKGAIYKAYFATYMSEDCLFIKVKEKTVIVSADSHYRIVKPK